MGISFLNLTMGLLPGNTRKELVEHFGNGGNGDFAARVCWGADRKNPRCVAEGAAKKVSGGGKPSLGG